jgi:hypothetical protein
MKSRALAAVWTAAMLALVATTAVRWRRVDGVPGPSLSIPALRSAAAPLTEPLFDSIAAEMVANDPFRLSNAPSRTRYTTLDRPSSLGSSPVHDAHDARPTMTLKAIAGGPPWKALIEGIPGQARAVLVEPGTVLDRLSIRAITRDGVLVRGLDTTWVLGFAGPP